MSAKMLEYRWQKGDKFVEIEFGLDSGDEGPIAAVNQNVYAQPLAEWRDLIPMTDKERLNSLIHDIDIWAVRNGFTRVQQNSDSS